MSIRVYWKVYITEDTRKNPETNKLRQSIEKGFYGKTPGKNKSKKLSLKQLQEYDKAKILPEDKEEQLWTLVDVVLQLATETDKEGYLSNQEGKEHSYNHIGNFWKHAVELGWDADTAWSTFNQNSQWVMKQAKAIIKEEFKHAPKGADKPILKTPSDKLPEDAVTKKTQASAKTKLGHRIRAHFKKRGKLVVPPKPKEEESKSKEEESSSEEEWRQLSKEEEAEIRKKLAEREKK